MKKVVIAGGGLSGLSVAYALSDSQQFDITVLESGQRTGGKIWTDKVDGFICEKGANGFLDNKPKTLELCGSLGVEPLRSNENAKKRYIFSDGRLNALPESPPAFLKSGFISWPGKLRMLYELIAPKGPEEETVADFIIRRLGKEALEKLIDPMVSGVYAGDPYKMSMKSCFPRIKEFEEKYGGLFRALLKIRKERKDSEVSVAPPGRLTSFHDGAQAITDALTDSLGDKVIHGRPVQGIDKNGDTYQVQTADGVIEADIVILASPAYASSAILKELDTELSDTLATITYPSLSVVCLATEGRRSNTPCRVLVFSYLIRKVETYWELYGIQAYFPTGRPKVMSS